MECKVFFRSTPSSFIIIRIYPEWNVKRQEVLTDRQKRLIRIYPEWNVKRAAQADIQAQSPIRIYPEWNVKKQTATHVSSCL